jgi:hypothetical protein
MAKKRPTGGVRFTTRITLKDGRVIFAKDYGLKAFPMRG